MRENERCLVIIPIVHTPADWGELRDKVPVIGEDQEAAITRYWTGIYRYIEDLSMQFKLRVYQDSLPNLPDEQISKFIEGVQTANFVLLCMLKERGAIVMGTEDPFLVKEEVDNLRVVLTADKASGEEARYHYMKQSALILEQRDDYIARRIDQTLQDGETGLLLIGADHAVGRHLESRMQVVEPEMFRKEASACLRRRS